MESEGKTADKAIGVKSAEKSLCACAVAYTRDPEKLFLLLDSALVYAKAKKQSRDNRDKWKAKRFLER